MKPTSPVDILPIREFHEAYDKRLTQQQLARATFYHLWLQFDHNEASVVRCVVETLAHIDTRDEIFSNVASVRLSFLNQDLRPVGFSQDTWGEMIDGDIYLERALSIEATDADRLRKGILVPYDDGVGLVAHDDSWVAHAVNEVLRKRPRHRRDDMNGLHD